MPKLTGNGWIYLIGYDDAGDYDPVKIGYAKHPLDRLSSLQTGSHRNLSLLDSIPGTKDGEKVFHEVLRDHRVNREWFYCREEILHAFDSIRERMLDKAEVFRPVDDELGLDYYYERVVPEDLDLIRLEMEMSLEVYSYINATGDEELSEDTPEVARLNERSDFIRGQWIDTARLFPITGETNA